MFKIPKMFKKPEPPRVEPATITVEKTVEVLTDFVGYARKDSLLEKDLSDYSSYEAYTCDYCGHIYKKLDKFCDGCGAPLVPRLKKVYYKPESVPIKRVQAPKYRPVISSPSTARGQLVIKADDGDIQIEPFHFDGTTGQMSTFLRAGLNFAVNRKPGHIVDITVDGGESDDYLRFYVNGKDTGVNVSIAGLRSTISNRMPATYPIAGGAALQLKLIKMNP